MRRERTESAVVHVILARPHRLDRLADLFRQHHRVDDEIDVAIAAAPETAAHQKVVQLHLVARNAEQLGRRLRGRGLALRAGPDLDCIARGRYRGDRVQRLHLRMIGVVAAILALDHTRGFLDLAANIALGAPVDGELLQILGAGRKGIVSLVAVEAPGHPSPGPGHRTIERLPSGERSPRGLRDHADAVRQPDDRGDAGDRLRLGIVDLVRDRSFDRGPQHGAVQHSRHLNVDAVGRCAGDLVRQFDPHHVLADQAEVGGLLELLRLDLRRLGRHLGEGSDVAIAQLASGFRVHHHARFGGQFLDRNAPLPRRIVEQHAAHLRAHGPQRPIIARHRIGTGGVLHTAEAWIAVDFLVDWRRHDLHPAPVGVELFRDDQRQRGHRPLPHLGRGRHDRDGAVGCDAHPRVQCGTGALGRQNRGVGVAGAGEGECQSGGADHHLTARQRGFETLDMLVHVTPPSQRARPRARCVGRCRSGRGSCSCARQSRRASAWASA